MTVNINAHKRAAKAAAPAQPGIAPSPTLQPPTTPEADKVAATPGPEVSTQPEPTGAKTSQPLASKKVDKVVAACPYEELPANTMENIALKDAAVLSGKRVEKLGSGTGAIYRIYQ